MVPTMYQPDPRRACASPSFILSRFALVLCLSTVTVLGLVAGCGTKSTTTAPQNLPPTINAVALDPRRAAPGDTVEATAVAGDPEGAPVTFDWRASAGTFLDSLSRVATWVAPSYAETCTLTVTVSDGTSQVWASIVVPVGVGTLVIESYPQGAVIIIDSEQSAHTTPVTLSDTPAGLYVISVDRHPFSYSPLAVSVNVPINGTAGAVFKLNDEMMALTQMTVDVCILQTSWSPSGTKMAGARRNEVADYVAIETYGPTWPDYFGDYLLTGGPEKGDIDDWAPSWSPEGDEFLFTSNRVVGTSCIYKVSVWGGTVSDLVYPGESDFPVWCPDATHFAFTCSYGQGFALATAQSSGSQVTMLVEDVLKDRPTWKPDGMEIAFSKLVGSDPYIFVVPSAGGVHRQVSHVPGTHPHWSPDGTKIAFVSPLGGQDNVWILFLQQGAEALDGWLTTSGADWPAWRPDGTAMSYTVPSTSEECRAVWLAQEFPF